MHLLTADQPFSGGSRKPGYIFRAVSCRYGLTLQLYRVMKLTALLFTVACLQAAATGNAQKITLHFKNVPVQQVIKEASRQAGVSIVYNDALFTGSSPVTIRVKNASMQQVLDQCFKELPFVYAFEGALIVIKKQTAVPAPEPLYSTPPPPPPPLIDVKGRVVDEEGKPVAGASVQVKGNRTKGVTTNEQGYFELKDANENETLVITGVNIESYELKISGRTDIVITVKRKITEEQEIIVNTGYWTTTQKKSTGNIAKVTAEEIARQPVGNPLGTLEGKVPGLVITQTTGLPGGAVKVELRGRTAIDRNITDDQPLFIVDDVPFGPNNGWLSTTFSALGYPQTTSTLSTQGGASPFNSLNPADIESIEVLKDADATAIYGSRGANGVIRITTKKGKAGKTKVDFNTYMGLSRVARPVEMMDTRQYVAMRRQAFANAGAAMTLANAYDLLVWDTTRYTDFVDLLAGNTARTHQAQLSVSGGNNQTQFLISGNFRKETTIMPGDFADIRSGINFQLSHQSINQKFKMIFGGTYNLDRNDLITQDPMISIGLRMPHMLVYNPDGSLAWNEGGYRANNPLAIIKNKYRSDGNMVQGNLQLSYAILPGLIIKTNIGYNRNQLDEERISPNSSYNPMNGTFRGAYVNTNRFHSYLVEPQLDYQLKTNYGKIAVLLGATWQQTINNGTQITATGFGSDDLMSSIGAATDYTASNNYAAYRYAAVFGRVGYDWQGKYLLNLSSRRDGSSRFGAGKQFANFGAIGAAWIFSEEEWIENTLSFLSFGKLRGSVGVTGNDKITNYQYLDTWMVTTSPYNGVAGLYPNKLYNPDYRWEKTTKWEAALDLGFFNERLTFSAVYFRHQSSNQLTNYRLPSTAGFTAVVANLPATVRNSGWEFVFGSINIRSADFRWSTSINATLPRNRLVSFPGLSFSSYASTFVEGQPLNLIRAYRYTGVDPQTGLYMFEDVDKNGTYNTADYQVVGNLDPTVFGGMQNSFRYKQVELNFSFSFRKQTGRNYLASLNIVPGNLNNNLPAKMTGFWQQPGDNARLQKLTSASSPEFQRLLSSSGIYSDASFARLRNVELAYRLPATWLSKFKLQQARIYVQGQNLLTFTNYEIGDPETQWLTRTPPLRTVSFGIQITL